MNGLNETKQFRMGKAPASSRVDGYLALEMLGRILIYAPCVGLLFTSFWSVGVALVMVLAPMAWLGRGGEVPAWMRAKPEAGHH